MGDAVGVRRRVPEALRSRRVLAVAATVLAALLWWPVGFWGLDQWPGVPLRALEGDVVALSATAAAAVVAALVRDPWPRLAVVAGASALAWWTSAPAVDTAPDEREVLVLLLLAGGVLGVLVGRRAQVGPVACASVLAVVAALTQATWPTGAALAAALALPFAVATWHRVAPTLWSVAGVLGLWLAASLAAMALRSGWDVLQPQMHAGSKRAELRLVLEAAWEFLRTQWREAAGGLLGSHAGWFWVAAVLAALVVAARVAVRLRRTATSSGRTGRPDERLTSGGPRR
jgi:hypothetical protein